MAEHNSTEKISVMLTTADLTALDACAADHRWSRSTAAAELIERGLAIEASIPAGRALHEATEEIYRRATEGIPRTARAKSREEGGPGGAH